MFKRERDGGEAERGEKKQKTDTNTVESQLEYLHQMQAASSDGKSDVPESLSSEAPSRVVHFRNMTPDVEQGDIISLCSPFGQIDNVLIMRAKNQCLVMFHQLKEAVAFFNHFAQNFTSPTVRGRKMFVKYSRHQVITAANSAVSNILLATLDVRPSAFQVPITADVVWQIFSPYGTVAKIVIMNKGSLQSLIQFQTQAQCCTAFDYLHDKSVFVGTEPEVMEIRITVQYSHLGELTVRYPSSTSADYVNPNPVAGAGASAPLLPTPPGYQTPAPPPAPFPAAAAAGYPAYPYPYQYAMPPPGFHPAAYPQAAAPIASPTAAAAVPGEIFSAEPGSEPPVAPAAALLPTPPAVAPVAAASASGYSAMSAYPSAFPYPYAYPGYPFPAYYYQQQQLHPVMHYPGAVAPIDWAAHVATGAVAATVPAAAAGR